MGVSTDALLFYGYCFEDEEKLLDDPDREWPEVVAARRGVKNPWDDYGRADLPYEQAQKRLKAWMARHDAELDEWHAALRAIEAEFGCDIGYHGSDGWSVPYVHVKASRTRAARGYPVGFEELPAARPEWAGMLDRFVGELGINKPQESPKWWLASYWG